jgi:hypothetical protein
MRFGAKMMLWACCAGSAMAAMLVTGSGPASASALTTGSHGAVTFGPHNQHGGNGPRCSRWQREQWNVNGTNTVDLVYNSGNYTYAVTFRQDGSCLGGTLTDTGLAPGSQNLAISGTVDDSHITFSVTYPTGYQGTRTFSGRIGRHGAVSGTWDETGTENGTGTWSLAANVNPACSHHHWWDPRRECRVRS